MYSLITNEWWQPSNTQILVDLVQMPQEVRRKAIPHLNFVLALLVLHRKICKCDHHTRFEHNHCKQGEFEHNNIDVVAVNSLRAPS
jgi:hypothetical protein